MEPATPKYFDVAYDVNLCGTWGTAKRSARAVSLGPEAARWPAMGVSTLAHEMAHLLDPASWSTVPTAALAEIVAESAAAQLLAHLCGAPLSRTSLSYVLEYRQQYRNATGAAVPPEQLADLERRVTTVVGLLGATAHGDAAASSFASALLERNARR